MLCVLWTDAQSSVDPLACLDQLTEKAVFSPSGPNITRKTHFRKEDNSVSTEAFSKVRIYFLLNMNSI